MRRTLQLVLALLICLPAVARAQVAPFVYDGGTLPTGKTDFAVQPSVPASQKIVASEWNGVMQDVYDTRTAVWPGGLAHGFQVQQVPVPPPDGGCSFFALDAGAGVAPGMAYECGDKIPHWVRSDGPYCFYPDAGGCQSAPSGTFTPSIPATGTAYLQWDFTQQGANVNNASFTVTSTGTGPSVGLTPVNNYRISPAGVYPGTVGAPPITVSPTSHSAATGGASLTAMPTTAPISLTIGFTIVGLTTASDQLLFGKEARNDTSWTSPFGMFLDLTSAGGLSFCIMQGGGQRCVASLTPQAYFLTGPAHLLNGCWDGSNLTIWADGYAIATSALSGTTVDISGDGPWFFGAPPSTGIGGGQSNTRVLFGRVDHTACPSPSTLTTWLTNLRGY